MADDKNSTPQNPGKSSGTVGKRPYATLDLRATEINVAQKKSSPQETAAASSAATAGSASIPLPASAAMYAMPKSATTVESSEAPMGAQQTNPGSAKSAASSASAASTPNVVVKRNGGFLSHLAAGIVGGAVALGAAYSAMPYLGRIVNPAQPSDVASDVSARLALLEKNAQTAKAPDLGAVEARIAALEKTAEAIPQLADGQKRLVAETKAALASAASDAGSPQLIERLGKLEDKFKALADAGANDPNAGRLPQLTALTSKITDLEAQLGTQLASLRSTVTKDVDARVQAASDASESAKSGTDRIDKDVATVKSDTARIEARVVAAKDQSDHVAADVKLVQEETSQLKSAFDTFKAAAAKPADIATAVAPVTERMVALEKTVQQVVQDDGTRKENAERVVLALELQNLRRALDSGQKFSAELDAVKKAAGGRVDLSNLSALQDRGVPSLADLTKQFRSSADRAIDADSDTEGSSVVDKLWAGAKSVVRVRRIDLKPDDKSTEATIGRMQVALTDGRLADVLETAKDLSPKAQDAARPFLEQVAARVGVDTALAGLEAQLKSSIASGTGASQSKPQP